MAYYTIKQTLENTEIIKNSRFIGYVCSVQSEIEAIATLQTIKQKHPDANHHCYAYIIQDKQRFSDDGEPAGTAGRPMFEVLQKRNLDHSLGIVTRYFGGTKLGAGGLVRAYSGSLAKTLDAAGISLIKDRSKLKLDIPFAHMDSIYRQLETIKECQIEETSYNETGTQLTLELFEEDKEELIKQLIDLSRGAVSYSDA